MPQLLQQLPGQLPKQLLHSGGLLQPGRRLRQEGRAIQAPPCCQPPPHCTLACPGKASPAFVVLSLDGLLYSSRKCCAGGRHPHGQPKLPSGSSPGEKASPGPGGVEGSTKFLLAVEEPACITDAQAASQIGTVSHLSHTLSSLADCLRGAIHDA